MVITLVLHTSGRRFDPGLDQLFPTRKQDVADELERREQTRGNALHATFALSLIIMALRFAHPLARASAVGRSRSVVAAASRSLHVAAPHHACLFRPNRALSLTSRRE